MSDDVLKVIPTDSHLVPSEDTHPLAVAFLERRYPDGEMCEAKVYGEVRFVDCGENLEAVVCPECGQHTSLDPFADTERERAWWIAVQEKLEAGGSVEDLRISMLCCNKSVALTSLGFNWPAGFARFELSIWNPNEAGNLSDGELASLADLLQCELTQVRAHY